MQIRHGGRLASCVSACPRDHFCRSMIAPITAIPEVRLSAAGLREVGLFNTAELQAIERRNAAQLMPKYKR